MRFLPLLFVGDGKERVSASRRHLVGFGLGAESVMAKGPQGHLPGAADTELLGATPKRVEDEPVNGVTASVSYIVLRLSNNQGSGWVG